MPDGNLQQSVVSFQSICGSESTRWFHGTEFRISGTEEEYRAEEPLFLEKMLCHLMIDAMPDDAIAETIESLRGLFDYYKPSDPSTRRLPEVNQHAATIGEQTIRPTFSLED